MPRLILFRHAKAGSTEPGSTDRERALTKSGRKQAAAMGLEIARYGPVDLALCSDARRAKETWDIARSALDHAPETRLLRAVYDADDYLPILNAEGGDAATAIIVGHNPTMQETALALVGGAAAGGDAGGLAKRFRKAAIAVLDFDGSWAALDRGRARLAAFIEPGDT